MVAVQPSRGEGGSGLVVVDDLRRRELTRERCEAPAFQVAAAASVIASVGLLDQVAGDNSSGVGVAVSKLAHKDILPPRHSPPSGNEAVHATGGMGQALSGATALDLVGAGTSSRGRVGRP